ncbi:MAG: hypothetical protein JWM21_4359 [Acidobacteria bacterium]|nr:hypothetical protein [Acidobacteriota bacterium]
MLHNRHSILASVLAAVLGLGSLLNLAETRARQIDDTLAKETSPPTQLDPDFEPAANPAPAGSVTDTRASATIHEAPGLRVPTWLRALELPSLAKLTTLDKAYLDAFSILREDNDCSRFYGGPRAVEALNQLKLQLKMSYFDRSIGLRMHGNTSYTTNNLSGLAYRLFEKAELNINGPFYKTSISPLDSKIPRIGEFSPNTREARVTILLHELGHLILTSDNQYLLPNDGSDSQVSRQNTARVIEICRRQIKAQSQVSFEHALASLQAPSNAKRSQLAAITGPSGPGGTNISRSTP